MNAALPFPGQGVRTVTGLRMPAGSGSEPVPLRLELVSGAEAGDGTDVLDVLAGSGVVLESQTMMVDPPVAVGDPIVVEVAVDENQVVRFTARVRPGGGGEQVAQIMLDNPFSVVENPGADMERLLELEERVPGLPRSEQPEAIVEMAGLSVKLGQRERAREMYERALKQLPRPRHGHVLNLQGQLCGDLRDYEAEIGYYRRAPELQGGSAPLFNHALRLIEESLVIDDDPAGHVLRAQLLGILGRQDEAEAAIEGVMGRISLMPVSRLPDYQLSRFRLGAEMWGREDLTRICSQSTRSPRCGWYQRRS